MRYDPKTKRTYFPEIQPLQRSMIEANAPQDIFRITYNKVTFSIIFSTKSNPYELLFGTVGTYNCSFVLQLYQGYMLESLSSETYVELCRILNLNYKDGGFSSNVFLQHIAKHIPKVYSGEKIQPHQIAAVKRDIEEADKIYFLSWIHHVRDGCHAQLPNLDKTKKLCGDQAAKYCKENNVSSRWTDELSKGLDYKEPWED